MRAPAFMFAAKSQEPELREWMASRRFTHVTLPRRNLAGTYYIGLQERIDGEAHPAGIIRIIDPAHINLAYEIAQDFQPTDEVR